MVEGDFGDAREVERSKAEEARALFKGFLDFVGCDVVEKVLKTAEINQESGLKGAAVSSEDRSFMLTVDETGVSFTVKDWGTFVITTDTAKVAIQEKRAEADLST